MAVPGGQIKETAGGPEKSRAAVLIFCKILSFYFSCFDDRIRVERLVFYFFLPFAGEVFCL